LYAYSLILFAISSLVLYFTIHESIEAGERAFNGTTGTAVVDEIDKESRVITFPVDGKPYTIDSLYVGAHVKGQRITVIYQKGHPGNVEQRGSWGRFGLELLALGLGAAGFAIAGLEKWLEARVEEDMHRLTRAGSLPGAPVPPGWQRYRRRKTLLGTGDAVGGVGRRGRAGARPERERDDTGGHGPG
jgi:hypothetical protein